MPTNNRINCPFCLSSNTYTKTVYRSSKKGTVRRNKHCGDCYNSFYTVELLEIDYRHLTFLEKVISPVLETILNLFPDMEAVKKSYEKIKAKPRKRKK